MVDLLNREVSPQSVWDALFAGAGELLLRQPGIVSLHAVTSTNALHFAFQASGDDRTRRLLMLQNAAFLPMFRAAMDGRGKVTDARIDKLEPVAPKQVGPGALEEIFAEAGRDRMTAAGKALSYLQTGCDAATTDRRSAASGVLEGRRPPRLQVQLGRSGGLQPSLARLARPLPGLEPAPAAAPGGQGQLTGAADQSCTRSLNAFSRSLEGEPAGEPRRNPARTEPRPLGIMKRRSDNSRLKNGHSKILTLDRRWRCAAAVGRRLVLTTEQIRDTRPAQENAMRGRGARET